jgi:hypothetical protein
MGLPGWLLDKNLKIKIRIVKVLRLVSSSMRCLFKTFLADLMKTGKKKKVIMIKCFHKQQKTMAKKNWK